MPRVPGRDTSRLRKLTEEVVVELISRSLASTSSAELADMLSANLSEVAAEVNKRSDDHITTGFLQNHYETKAKLVEKSIARYLGPETSHAKRLVRAYVKNLDNGKDPVATRRELAERDVKNMTTEHPDWSRLGFAFHARSENPSVRAALGKMYDAFDLVMIPAYRRDLEARGRRLREQFAEEDLAAAYTAITEGLATRALASDHPDTYHRLAATMVEAVTAEMTEEAL